MNTTDIKTALNRACIKQRVDPEVRRRFKDGTWREVVETARSLEDEQLDALGLEVFGEAVWQVLGPGIKHRGHWIVRSEAVDEDRLLIRLQELAGVMSCEKLPERLAVVPMGAPRSRGEMEPGWARMLASVNYRMSTLPEDFELDCRLVNAVIDRVHPESAQLARVYFAAAFLGALDGNDQPWRQLFELLLDGYLVEAIYADGTAQVATRVL